MGPPPPPPPPPPLKSSTVLPPRSWKTADAPRRNNNPVPAPSQPSRPRVDCEALQHAAARLRKTGYNEQIRDNVSNLPDGRLDRQNEPLSGRNWQNCPQQQKLDVYQTREQIPSASSDRYQPDPVNQLHRPPHPINKYSTPLPSDIYSFDKTPKYLYNTFNEPASESFINNNLPHVISHQTTSSTSTSTYHNNNNNNNNKNNNTYNDDINKRYTAPSSISPTPARDATYTGLSSNPSPARYTAPTNISPPVPQAYTGSTTTSSTRFTNSTTPGTRETSLEWTTPYTGPSSTILDPQRRIHSFATNNYVQEEFNTSYVPNGSHSSPNPRLTRQQQLAAQIRDEGLTASQKSANQKRQSGYSTNTQKPLPFDVNQMIRESFTGDEVDHLVVEMANQLNSRTPPTNVMQRTNICVACNSEITADKPGCTALDQVFHVACFNCKRCSKVLAGASFYNIDNDPICEQCYQDSLDKCTKCGQAISDKLLRACGGTFHVNCFTCTVCQTPLDGVPFTVDGDNQVHCVPCFHEKFAPRCAVCNKGIIPVEGEKESVRVVAMNKSFHVDCYRCEDCNLQLSSKIEGQGCYPLESHLYCKTCNSNRLRVATTAR